MNITERVEQRGHTLVLCCVNMKRICGYGFIAMRGEECRVARTLRGEVRAGERQRGERQIYETEVGRRVVTRVLHRLLLRGVCLPRQVTLVCVSNTLFPVK